MDDGDPFGVLSQFDRRYRFFSDLCRHKECGRMVLVSGDAGLYVSDDIPCELYPDQSLFVFQPMGLLLFFLTNR